MPIKIRNKKRDRGNENQSITQLEQIYSTNTYTSISDK